MDRAYYTLVVVAAIGVGYGLLRGRRSSRKSRGGWLGLGVLAVLFIGLVVAAQSGNESVAWFFGLALMVVVPVMFFLAIGSAIGRALGRDESNSSAEHDQ